MRTALVTGGAGFLGRVLIPRLLEAGYEVHSVDPEYGVHGLNTDLGCGHVVHLYAERFETFQIKAKRYDLVFHLASYLTKYDIEQRNKMGMEAFRDIDLDLQMAQYLENLPPRERVVWLSSCATDAEGVEVYAFNKYVSERFARWLGKRERVPISILKPYAGYGPGQSLSYPMTAIIHRALRLEDPLYVWGSKKTVRDWIYVDDIVDAILMAADGIFPKGGAIPIGTGVPTSFGELAMQIALQCGYSPQITADLEKPIGSEHRVATTAVAESFGFKAKVTLAEGLARCIAVAKEKSATFRGVGV
jgi:nucleoside-diphosphate-sugar epimerase